MKLHLGSGNVHLPGYLNVDRRYQPGVDRVDNIGILQHMEGPAFQPIDEIYCCHALDHFTRWEYPAVLRRWVSLLRHGGKLRISLPDFRWTAEEYFRGGNLRALTGQIYASQDYPDNVRHFAWDFTMAQADLVAAGCDLVERYDPLLFFAEMNFTPCDASTFVDERGVYRSLNVVARKP